jgi:hypothetical protein
MVKSKMYYTYMYDTVIWNIVGKENFGYSETLCMQLIGTKYGN